MKNEVTIFEEEDIKLEVNISDDTVWLTQKQIANLFRKTQSTISEHIKNIFEEKELEEGEVVRKFGNSEKSTKPTYFYNLDVIISVGYRVKSKRGTQFRKWANKVLKDYLLKGYVVNQKRLEYLEKAVKIIDIANRITSDIKNDDAKEILNVISKYTKSLEMLDNYDHKKIVKPKGSKNKIKIKYDDCIKLIDILKQNQNSTIFAIEREIGLDSIISNIYQTYNKEDVYSTIQEKAANFLYMIIKNHIFIDGNKRIAATLFIYFLFINDILYIDGNQTIDNNTLTALTLLIAESNPNEKETIIDLVMNFLVN
ncbi:MAG TPA: RhuM family protein [Bacilli bacterium]|nr:RhuM family protein [Bacilli bacterium]